MDYHLHPQHLSDEYELIQVRIGQKVNFFNSNGVVSSGEVVAADVVSETVDILTGDIIKFQETIHIDNLIEG